MMEAQRDDITRLEDEVTNAEAQVTGYDELIGYLEGMDEQATEFDTSNAKEAIGLLRDEEVDRADEAKANLTGVLNMTQAEIKEVYGGRTL